MANPNSSAQRSFAAEPYDSVAAVLASKQITGAMVGQVIHTKEGHSFRVVTSDWDEETAGGAKLAAQLPLNAAQFGAKGDASVLAYGMEVPYQVSGADNAAKLSKLFESAVKKAAGTVDIPAGKYYAGDDLTVYATASARDTTDLKIKGAGRANAWVFTADVKTGGTSLYMAPGKRLKVKTGGVGYHFSDMLIAGSVTDGPLVSSETARFNDLVNDHGGFERVEILNHLVSAPTAGSDPVALEVKSLYTSHIALTHITGRADFSDVWADQSKSVDGMYHGTGLDITRSGGGTGGALQKVNVRGFSTGIRVGLTRSAWDADANKYKIGHITAPVDLQLSFCREGMFIGNGASVVDIFDPAFEYCADHFIKLSGEKASLRIRGGVGAQPVRVRTGGNQYMKNAMFVIGDAVAAESRWGHAHFSGFHFDYLTQAGILAYGGSNAGEIVLDGCTARYNGGPLMIVDPTNGVPDILIKNFLGTSSEGEIAVPVSMLVTTATLKNDYTQHTGVSDARWLARIENSPGYEDGIQCPSIDLTNRKYPPASVAFNTSSAGGGDKSITLGNKSCLGMKMRCNKFLAGGNLNIVIPSGITVIDAAGTQFTGPVTKAISAVGYYDLERIYNNVWRISATLPA